MNYDGVHDGYITLHKRDEEGVSFTVNVSSTVSMAIKGGLAFLGFWGGVIVGLFFAFSIGAEDGGVWFFLILFGIGGFCAPFFLLGKKMEVTANKEHVSFGKDQISAEGWGGFIIKEAEQVANKYASETVFTIFYRDGGVDYGTRYHLSKSTQDAEIINQMNMLVNEAIGKKDKYSASKPSNRKKWV